MLKGNRKMIMCWTYMGCTTCLCHSAIVRMSEFGMDQMSGLASLCIGMATGLGVVVWGNVQSHRAANGNGK